jgi:hypothetical protein
MMNVLDFEPDPNLPSFDLSEIIMHECVCGSDMWRIVVTFSNYEISSYMLDMECIYCGTRAKAPTPIDHPDYKENDD